MFGIDLGISVSSVSCITGEAKVLDYQILFGDSKDKNEWRRITQMAEAIVDVIAEIGKRHPDVYIEPLASIEEPIYPYRTRNPRSFFNLCCLYALTRNKLSKRGYEMYSINPVSVKATAKGLAFKDKNIKSKWAVRGRLNKIGMIVAYKKLIGAEPNYNTKVGRETLADSYFIAVSGLDRRKVGVR